MKQQHSRKTLGIIIGSLVAIGIILCILLAGFTGGQNEGISMKTTASGLRYKIIKKCPGG